MVENMFFLDSEHIGMRGNAPSPQKNLLLLSSGGEKSYSGGDPPNSSPPPPPAPPKKNHYSRDIDDQRILKSDWPSGRTGHTQPKVVVPDPTFL